MKKFIVSTLAVMLIAVSASFADTTTVAGMGHCGTDDFCFGGQGAGDFGSYSAVNGTPANSLRDWFMVNLAGIGNITSATLNIWDIGGNDPLMDFYAATGLTYSGLADGSIIASGTVPTLGAGDNEFVSFTLNADGIAALNAARLNIDGDGNAYFTFGGNLPNGGDSVFTNGFSSQHLPFLQYTTGDVTSDTPEPATLALLGTGVLGIASSLRKRFVK